MCNSFTMSFFMPPISPVRERETGRTTKMPTLTPLRSVDLQEVYQLITTDRRLAQLTLEVRKAADEGDEQTCRMLKQQTLPYVTPCGVFSRRRSDCLQQESGLLVVDIDHLDSTAEAEALRRQLFDDPYLQPALVFVSPTGRGVKAFVPRTSTGSATQDIGWAMEYVHCMYDSRHQAPGKGVDTSGKDLVRACFLCHDPGALVRGQVDKGQVDKATGLQN